MILTVIGDILSCEPVEKAQRQIIVCHQVNCMGIMGKGLAHQIKKKFPIAYKEYKKYCTDCMMNERLPLGEVQFIRTKDYLIANCFGQYNYGYGRCHTDYSALRKCFDVIKNTYPNAIIRIPYHMGCGLAGGDWKIVSRIIEEELVRNGCRVEIWQLEE